MSKNTKNTAQLEAVAYLTSRNKLVEDENKTLVTKISDLEADNRRIESEWDRDVAKLRNAQSLLANLQELNRLRKEKLAIAHDHLRTSVRQLKETITNQRHAFAMTQACNFAFAGSLAYLSGRHAVTALGLLVVVFHGWSGYTSVCDLDSCQEDLTHMSPKNLQMNRNADDEINELVKANSFLESIV